MHVTWVAGMDTAEAWREKCLYVLSFGCRQINRREHPEKLKLHRSTKSSVFTHVVWVHHRVLELIVFQPERSVSLSHAPAYPSLTFCQDPRRGKGRAVPDRQLIRTEPKGPSLYQRKKGIETTYSLSEEECHGGLMRRSRQQTGTGARWAGLPDWPGPGHLVAVEVLWILFGCDTQKVRRKICSTGTKIFEKY